MWKHAEFFSDSLNFLSEVISKAITWELIERKWNSMKREERVGSSGKRKWKNDYLMPGNTNVPFEVSDHEFKMGPVNMLWFFSLATVAALTEVQSKQKLDSTSTGFLSSEYIINWGKDIMVESIWKTKTCNDGPKKLHREWEHDWG